MGGGHQKFKWATTMLSLISHGLMHKHAVLFTEEPGSICVCRCVVLYSMAGRGKIETTWKEIVMEWGKKRGQTA